MHVFSVGYYDVEGTYFETWSDTGFLPNSRELSHGRETTVARVSSPDGYVEYQVSESSQHAH